jgi:ribosomal protein S18 acetylase RimI-like enzyme
VRKIRIDELNSLKELFQYNDVDAMVAENRANIENEIMDIFVLYEAEKLLGELHVAYESEDGISAIKGKRAYIFAFRIRKEYQNQGIGKILFQSVLDILEKDGYMEFTIGVEDDNERARHIYHDTGFTDVIARKKESYQGDSYEYDLLLRRVSAM